MSKMGICENPKCPHVDRQRLADPANIQTLHLKIDRNDWDDKGKWLCATCF